MIISGPKAGAWNQETHKQINYEAIQVHNNQFSQGEKYRLGTIDPQGFQEKYRGIAVRSSSLFQDVSAGGLVEKYEIEERVHTMPLWIIYGGDWADEPHLYASGRHFYDPLKVSGQHYLTDQSWAHGKYESPAIDAMTWGLNHDDNPFSLYQALSYYKRAMEVPETELPQEWLAQDHFKLNLALVPKDRNEERGIYLARAYRALGEVMHMMADMTQPAHTRNDSHPLDEPIEDNIFSADVIRFAKSPVDWQIGHMISSAGGEGLSPKNLFHQVALYTNQNFYSMDTIFDEIEGIKPQNGQKPYPNPQFKDLLVEEFSVPVIGSNNTVEKKTVKKIFGAFVNDKIPLAQERLSYTWFQPSNALKEKLVEKTLGRYQIPPSIAKEQGRVLLPIAIHACADLMDMFFPTLELIAQYNELELNKQQADNQDKSNIKVIEVNGEMVHRQKDDLAWLENGLKIDYSGPGKLIFEKDGKVIKTRELHFLKGKIEKIETHEGKMEKAPLEIFVKNNDEATLTEEESFYEGEIGTRLYLEVKGGSRTFKSSHFDIKGQEINLRLEPTIAVGEPGAYFDFKALVSPSGNYRYEWDFERGKSIKDGSPEEGYTYKDEGNYKVTVRLYDEKGKLLAEDSSTASAKKSTLIDKLHNNTYMAVYFFYENHPDSIRTDYLINMHQIKPIWSGNGFSYFDEHGSLEPGNYYRLMKASGFYSEEKNTISIEYEYRDRRSSISQGIVEYDDEYLKFSIKDLPFSQSFDDDWNRGFDYFKGEINPQYITIHERWKENYDKTMGMRRDDKKIDFKIKGEINVHFQSPLNQ